MATKCPVFPVPHSSNQFVDYGFDPLIHYSKVQEEARKHRKELQFSESRAPTNFPHKNQTQHRQQGEEGERVIKKGIKKRWWNHCSLFFRKTKRFEPQMSLPSSHQARRITLGGSSPARRAYSGPVYGSTDVFPSRKSLPATPELNGGRADDEEFDVPYLSLKELNMADHERRISTSPPIYLVT